MALWVSLCNKHPVETGNYYVADINGELFKCKWDGEHFNGNNIIAWLKPDDNQTSDDAYKEYNETIVNYMLNNPYKAFDVSCR